MILSDFTIKQKILSGEIKCRPGDGQSLDQVVSNIVCASMDLQLGNEFKFFGAKEGFVLDPFEQDTTEITEYQYVPDGESIVISPGAFVLAATKERFGIPADIVARVEGRSSLGRLGLIIHVTAGFIDPGFGWDSPSTITLEISNINHVPIVLRPGMRICQLAFDQMDRPAEMPYNKKKNAKYNGQVSPQESRLFRDGESA